MDKRDALIGLLIVGYLGCAYHVATTAPCQVAAPLVPSPDKADPATGAILPAAVPAT